MQATNNALAEETGCAKDSDDRCDHSVPDIVTVLLWTREDCDGSSGSDDGHREFNPGRPSPTTFAAPVSTEPERPEVLDRRTDRRSVASLPEVTGGGDRGSASTFVVRHFAS